MPLNHLDNCFCKPFRVHRVGKNCLKLKGSWDSIVSVVTRLWAGPSVVQIPAGPRDLSRLHIVQTGCVIHTEVKNE
jgi:hypothetical protein